MRARLRETDVRQVDGSMSHIEYRFTYVLNGFVATWPPMTWRVCVRCRKSRMSLRNSRCA